MLKDLIEDIDGGFKDKEGCWWETKSDYICMGILHSCGCGEPSSIGKYVKDMLLKHVKQTNSEDYSCWDITKYNDLPVIFFLSWAYNEGYTEHGSTIRCSWMSPKGNELLKDLIEIEKDEIDSSI